MAQLPEIPWLARRHRCGPPGIDGISGIGWVILKVRSQLIDLDRRALRQVDDARHLTGFFE